MFKRIFGKADEEPSGLNVGRLVTSASADDTASRVDRDDFQLPSRKPPPDVGPLVLPETLAQEARHPREVDVQFDLRQPAPEPGAIPAPIELTEAQLERIAQRVADKLAAGVIGDRLREAVSRIVSETSERLIREEIARIRAEGDRE